MPSKKRPWSPERRAAASMEAKLRYDQTPPEVREAWLEKGRRAYQEKYPHRAGLYADVVARIESGEIQRETCPDCGGEGRLQLCFDDEARTVEVLGWRCYECRRRPAEG